MDSEQAACQLLEVASGVCACVLDDVLLLLQASPSGGRYMACVALSWAAEKSSFGQSRTCGITAPCVEFAKQFEVQLFPQEWERRACQRFLRRFLTRAPCRSDTGDALLC